MNGCAVMVFYRLMNVMDFMRKSVGRLLLVGAFLTVFAGCARVDKKPVPNDWDSLYGDTCSFLFEYVYVDRNAVLHVSRRCLSLRDSMAAVLYIDTLDLRDSCFRYYCPRCVNNKRAKHVKEILRRQGASLPGRECW